MALPDKQVFWGLQTFSPYPSSENQPEAWQGDRACLSSKERHHRREQWLCMYCGEAGLFASSCSRKEQNSSLAGKVAVSSISSSGATVSCPLVQVRILLPTGAHTLATFIDSGADGNTMDENLAQQLGVTRVPLPQVFSQGPEWISLGTVTHRTSVASMCVPGTHRETIQFLLLLSISFRIFLAQEAQSSY